MELLRAQSLSSPHGFSTRHGGVSEPPFDTLNLSLRVGDDSDFVARNRIRLFVAAGEVVYTAHQVHGTRIATVAEIKDGAAAAADGLWSRNPGEIVGVYIADCLPVLIEDPVTGAVAAVHAGWKGLIAGVVENAIATLVVHGSKEADLRFAIGPGIRKCCFVVDEDLAKRFADTYTPSVVAGRNVDLPGALTYALQRRGHRQIEDIGRCTACEPATFFPIAATKGVPEGILHSSSAPRNRRDLDGNHPGVDILRGSSSCSHFSTNLKVFFLSVAFLMAACSQRDDQARKELTALQGHVARLVEDNQALRQRLEEHCHPAKTEPPQSAAVKRVDKPTLDTRLAVMEPPTITASTNIRDAASMTRAYLAGVEAVRTGNSKRGIPLLRQFARNYPWDARAADALFFAGTAALASNQADAAAADFATLVRLYPKSPLVPEALTRKGECAARAGRYADAQAAWKHVATNYSGTAAAEQAQLLLQNVQRKEHP